MACLTLLAACQAKPPKRTAAAPGDPCTTKPAYNPQRSKEWNDLRAQMQCAKLDEAAGPTPR